MKRLSLITFILFVLAISNSRGNDFYATNKAVSYIKKTLKTKQIELHGEVAVKNEFLNGNAIVIYTFQGEDQAVNYAIFREATGKHDKFDYLVIVNSNLKITHTRIIRYRSEHGGEIASKKWLTQFSGYSTGKLKYGSDISAISGATLSAKSITADIPKVISILKNCLN